MRVKWTALHVRHARVTSLVGAQQQSERRTVDFLFSDFWNLEFWIYYSTKFDLREFIPDFLNLILQRVPLQSCKTSTKQK